VLTDVQAWLSSLRRGEREPTVEFIAENQSLIRHPDGLHAKALISAGKALIGSAIFSLDRHDPAKQAKAQTEAAFSHDLSGKCVVRSRSPWWFVPIHCRTEG